MRKLSEADRRTGLVGHERALSQAASPPSAALFVVPTMGRPYYTSNDEPGPAFLTRQVVAPDEVPSGALAGFGTEVFQDVRLFWRGGIGDSISLVAWVLTGLGWVRLEAFDLAPNTERRLVGVSFRKLFLQVTELSGAVDLFVGGEV